MSPRKSLALAALVLTAGACAPAMEQKAAYRNADKTTVAVQNSNWMDVTLYLVRNTQRVRLGSVSSMSKATFTVPDAYVLGVSDITLQADPVGSTETYVSPPIQVYAGARVELRIENQMRLSSYAVYPTN